jgi:hypothetical protein
LAGDEPAVSSRRRDNQIVTRRVTEVHENPRVFDGADATGAMRADLEALLVDVRAGALSLGAFVERLDSIQARFLSEERRASAHVAERRDEAIEAFMALIGDLEKHHQVERLARALGLDSW